MSIKFTAEVVGSRDFEKKSVLTVKRDAGNFAQFIDCEFPAGEAPEGAGECEVEFGLVPSARAYEAKKVNPNTGKPYLNATITLWRPKVTFTGGVKTWDDEPQGEAFADDCPF